MLFQTNNFAPMAVPNSPATAVFNGKPDGTGPIIEPVRPTGNFNGKPDGTGPIIEPVRPTGNPNNKPDGTGPIVEPERPWQNPGLLSRARALLLNMQRRPDFVSGNSDRLFATPSTRRTRY